MLNILEKERLSFSNIGSQSSIKWGNYSRLDVVRTEESASDENQRPLKMMPTSKNFLKDFPLIRFYSILILSVFYFFIQLVVSHISHSLILQLDAYHMLYNILSLTTCIVTVKMCRKGGSLKNTFGWMRIHVCGAVANICFLAALCFSVTVECLQTLFHLSHHEKMHYSDKVGIVGVVGIAVNLMCFAVIGGYTSHQSTFLGSSTQGDDVIVSASVQSYVKRGVQKRKRRGAFEAFRDVFGTVLVIICAAITYIWEDNSVSNFFDPFITIFAVIVLILLSYSYAKDACHILLLTIPAHIDVKNILKELQDNFPEICDIHEFHVWQLTPTRIIASAHIVLNDAQGYLAIQHNVIDFLHTKGISQVTLQPEFINLFTSDKNKSLRKRKCFLPCGPEDCEDKQCCVSQQHLSSILSHSHGHSHQHSVHSHEPECSAEYTKIFEKHEADDTDDLDEVIEPELQPMI